MGCNFSCISPPPLERLETIRVVHLNGYVEDFGYPVTVSEVTGNPKRLFVCTHAQLASGGPHPLKPCTTLEPGHVYFLMPYSTIQSDVSPLDLAAIARKLNKIAKSGPSRANKPPLRGSKSGSSPVWSSPERSPNRFLGSPARVEPESGLVAYIKSSLRSSKLGSRPVWSSPTISSKTPNRFSKPSTGVEPESGLAGYDLQRSAKALSWKPILDTIREKSFGRRSESDLREKHLDILR